MNRLQDQSALDIHGEMATAINNALFQFVQQKAKETGLSPVVLMGAATAALLRVACIQTAAVCQAEYGDYFQSRNGVAQKWMEQIADSLTQIVNEDVRNCLAEKGGAA